jgi:predicted dithiol-disulfide oxidoreductase (DUF899 family)
MTDSLTPAAELAPLWNVLDLTPQGREPHRYPKLRYF